MSFMGFTLAIALFKLKQLIIYQMLNIEFNAHMDIYEFRRRRLNALIKEKYKYRKQVAEAIGWSEARLSQILSPTYRGGRGFAEKVARKLESDLQLEPMYFDLGAAEGRLPESHVGDVPSNDSGVVMIPLSRMLPNKPGNSCPEFEAVTDAAERPYLQAWIEGRNLSWDRLRRFEVKGDSMEPTMREGDVVLVNCDDTKVTDGRMYAIRYATEVRMRQLSRRLDGTLTLRCINPLYSEETIPAAVAEEHIFIIGRVIEITISNFF